MIPNRPAVIGAAVFAAAVFAAAVLCLQVAQAGQSPFTHLRHVEAKAIAPAFSRTHPWIEGVDPALENQLFDATYKALPNHNLIKVYAFDAGGFESAGIRFSARVPHQPKDLSDAELDHEAVTLIRTTFEEFPEIQEVDVWATKPLPVEQATREESTLFSVSADRRTYEEMSGRVPSDDAFLAAFGRVWVAPEVAQ